MLLAHAGEHHEETTTENSDHHTETTAHVQGAATVDSGNGVSPALLGVGAVIVLVVAFVAFKKLSRSKAPTKTE